MANIFTSYAANNVGTSPVSLVTIAAATQTTAIGMTVANTSLSPITVDVYFTRSSVDYYLVKGADVPVGGALIVIGGDQKLVLITGDILKVKSSAITSADAILSVLNIT